MMKDMPVEYASLGQAERFGNDLAELASCRARDTFKMVQVDGKTEVPRDARYYAVPVLLLTWFQEACRKLDKTAQCDSITLRLAPVIQTPASHAVATVSVPCAEMYCTVDFLSNEGVASPVTLDLGSADAECVQP
ncbi:MAG: hypothetical protein VX193_02480, partial [Candidatus Thermoplasmatota archaeon]|nr:hypothetical protein [Candidatus Thermoplasmatota archaeon]